MNTEPLKKINWEDAIQNGLVGASGTRYKLESELSAARYYKFQTYILEMQAGQDAAGVMALLGKAYAALNSPGGAKVADATVAINDAVRGLEDWGFQSRRCIMAIGLLFNRENDSIEVRKVFDETDLMKKVEDLEQVYGLQSFFALLTNITAGWTAS